MDEATRISLKDQFNSLLVRAIEGRRGGMALMRVLEELDFYNSPASAKHHLNVPGGLVLHSLNVARAALELCDKMPQFAKCNKDAVLTAALLHDVCKAGQYIKKPDGSYRYEDSHLMGHGEAYRPVYFITGSMTWNASGIFTSQGMRTGRACRKRLQSMLTPCGIP